MQESLQMSESNSNPNSESYFGNEYTTDQDNNQSIVSMKYEDKISMVNDLIAKYKQSKHHHNGKMNKMKNKKQEIEDNILQLKEEIKDLTWKVNEAKIASDSISREIKMHQVFLEENKIEEIEPNSDIQNDIEAKINEINLLSDEINAYAQYTLDITPEIEAIEKSIEKYRKNRTEMETQKIKFRKEKRKVYYDYLRLKKLISTHEKASQNFLQDVERKINLYTNNE